MNILQKKKATIIFHSNFFLFKQSVLLKKKAPPVDNIDQKVNILLDKMTLGEKLAS